MCIKKKKELNIFKCLNILLIIAVLALSFIPCIKIIDYPGFSPWIKNIDHPGIWAMNHNPTPTIRYENFLPKFCAIITIIEMLLLLISNRTWPIIIRFVLNLIKMSLPPLYFFAMKIDDFFCGSGITEICMYWSAYVIIGIGIVIAVVEIVEIIASAKNRKKNKKKKKAITVSE